MPTVKRRPVDLIPNPANDDPHAQVFFIDSTSEIFLDYTSYLSRILFLREHIFQCSNSGKNNLTYAEALASELSEAKKMEARFQPAIRGPILRSAAFQVMGRLDSLVDHIFERFKNRFWPGESLFVDLQGQKYFARVINVYPPKEIVHYIQQHREPDAKRVKTDPTDDSIREASGLKTSELHRMGVDLEIPQAEADAADPPLSYYYTVQLAGKDDKFSGSYMELKAASLSRDRLMFSKSILRRYLRDTLYRSTAVGAPWRVKPEIARTFNIPEEVTLEAKHKSDVDRKFKLEEMKKLLEGKPREPIIEQPQLPAPDLKPRAKPRTKAVKKEYGILPDVKTVVAAVRDKEKKKSTKYPCEDLDIILTTREINARSKENSLVRPTPTIPISASHSTFDKLLQVWSFLNIFEIPLHLSIFTLDDLTNVLQLTTTEQGVPELLTEIHVCLVNMLIRERDHVEGMTEAPLNEEASADQEWVLGTVDRYGNAWTRKLISEQSERKEQWLRATVGCLRGHLTNETHAQYRRIFAHLFPPKILDSNSDKKHGSTSSLSSMEDEARPEERYFTLSFDDKLLLLSALIDRVKMTKHIRNFVDKAEPQLTELRKEKVDLNREKKKLTEKLEGNDKSNSQAPPAGADGAPEIAPDSVPAQPSTSEQASEPVADNHSEGLSEPPPADEEANGEDEDDEEVDQLESDSNEDTEENEVEDDAMETEDNTKAEPEPVELTPEEEVVRLSNRVEEVDNEFRSTHGTLRLRPLGEDRFYNTYWFFDGLGSRPLQGTASKPGDGYETGRLFVHRPHLPDPAVMSASHELISRLMEDTESDLRKDENLYAQVEKDITNLLTDRRKEEEGEPGMLQPGEWGAFDSMGEIRSLMNWFQQKGNRELALRNSIQRWWPWLERSINSRREHLDGNAQDVKMEIDGMSSSMSYRSWKNKRRN
ncbi:hypothetical protein E3P94_02749 [Wallemia ichthyophaga]|nr:hypothetical protein E3P95_02698 [Wallemia ichthyophaga]TIA98929.1 hypothetical protein E3P94_02749 [Wallemia ichthyophaga]